MADTPQTVGEIIDVSAKFLENKRIPEARPSCELLMSRLLGCSRMDLRIKQDASVTEKQVGAMRRGLKRLSQGEPVQYITGSVEFMGLQFKTDKRALIPRPETELLVEEAIRLKGAWNNDDKCIVLDIGTGSGCIIISLSVSVPGPVYIGTDISEQAISLAMENAAAIETDSPVHFKTEMLEDFLEPQTISLIVSNPPYIKSSVCDQLPIHIRDHEPRQALDGGQAGTEILEEIIQDASVLLRPGGHILLEIGNDQGQIVPDILSGFGFTDVTVKKDYAGHDRIVHAVIG